VLFTVVNDNLVRDTDMGFAEVPLVRVHGGG